MGNDVVLQAPRPHECNSPYIGSYRSYDLRTAYEVGSLWRCGECNQWWVSRWGSPFNAAYITLWKKVRWYHRRAQSTARQYEEVEKA